MAKLKLSTVLKNEKGEELGSNISCLIMDEKNQFKKGADGNLLIATVERKEIKKTLKEVICIGLLHESPKKQLTAEEKLKRYRLWTKVNEAKEEVDLKTEELLMIKDCIFETQPILIAGQCEELIEG